MKRVLSFLLSLVIALSMLTGMDVSVLASGEYSTVTGVLENYVTSVVLDETGENWVSEIIVDGITYSVQKHLIDSEKAENAKGKDVVFTVYDSKVDSFYIINDLSPTITPELSSLNLIYENGRFPDKKIELSCYVNSNLLINSNINQGILSGYSNLTLTDISITLTSQNTDIIYFKSGAFGGKNSSVTFSLEDSLAIAEMKFFSQEARVNTGYDFPENVEEDTVKIICEINAKCGDNPISGTVDLFVTLTNNDYNYKSTWRKQSLISLMEQMESSVQTCSVLTSGERAEVTSTISAIIINEQMAKLSDDLDAFESIYDLSCYFYGLKTATMATAGEYFLDAIISECNKASDDLKKELNNLLESLTESKAFNKFIYWYYNNQQLQLGNKKQVNAHCPIDVSVMDEDGIEVLSIINDEVVTSLEGVAGFVCDSQKTIYLPTDIDHKIKITATNDGTMDYSVVEYSSNGSDRVVSYPDIELTNGEVCTGSVIRTELPAEESYKLTSSSDLTFTLSDDGAFYSVTDCDTSVEGEIVIPSTYNNLLVKEIDWHAFSGCSSLTSVTIPDSVTSIGNYAFEYCTSLTSITIPDSVTSIRYSTFRWCTNLICVTLANGVTSIGGVAFGDCINLTSITIPDSVTTINASAFNGCTKLTSIEIPDSVTSIGSSPFINCTNLVAINVDENNTSYSSVDGILFNKNKTILIRFPEGKKGTYTVPNSVTNIEFRAFKNCSNLISVTIPDNVTSIDDSAFSDCTNLASVTMSNSVKRISDNVFCNCASLTSITIPDSVTSIGREVFFNCTNLASVTMSNSVEFIGMDAFNNCANLESISIPNSVKYINFNAFFGCESLSSVYITDIRAWCEICFDSYESNPMYYAKNLYLNGILLTSVSIPDDVTSIGDAAFRGCESLTEITIPDSVKSIGDYAFNSCDSLTSINVNGNNLNYSSVNGVLFNKDKTVLIRYPEGKTKTTYTIPDSVTSIGNYAFHYCNSLTSITIPDSVTSIGPFAFEDCFNLDSIYYCGDVEERYEIAIQSGNDTLRNATWYYNFTGHNFSDWEIVKESTCTDVGEKKRVCSVCEYTEIVEITALGHNYSDGGKVSVEPTCTEGGQKTLVCSVCDYTETVEMSALGHDYSTEWIIDKVATCTEEGSKYHHCLRCSNIVDVTVIEPIGHLYSDWIIIKEPTIIEEGSRSKTCSICGDVVTEAIDVLGHDYSTEWTIDVAPTCTEEGSKSHHCSKCDSKTDVTIIPATGHDYGDWVVNKEPNCADEGLQSKSCSVCGFTETEVVSSLSHTFVDGVCSGCGIENSDESLFDYEITDDSVIITDCEITDGEVVIPDEINGLPVTEIGSSSFEGSEDITSIVIPGSVTNIGDSAFETCDSLEYIFYPGSESDWENVSIGDNNSAIIDAIIHYGSTDHNYIGKVDVEATCAEEGSKHQECSVCGYSLDSEVIHAFGHDYSTEWTIDKTATCIEEGSKSHHCSRCDIKSDITVISVSGHNYSTEWTIDAEPTCIKTGLKSYHCTTCGDKSNITEVPALGHDYSTEWFVDIEATCAKEGSKSHHCLRCDSKIDVTVVLAEHNYEDWITELEPTCTEGGVNYRICSGCNSTETIELPALGHNYIDGICTICGGESLFEYSIENNCVTITGYNGIDTNVVIPSVIDGMLVTTIGEEAFYDCDNIITVIIPDSVTHIEYKAFYWCTSLISISIPDSVVSIGERAFENCKKLTSIKIPKNVINIGDAAFSSCSSLTSIIIPNGVTSIGNSAFSHCYGLTSVKIPDSVTNIGKHAFYYCTSLTSVAIPNSVIIIAGSTFSNCKSLTSITIPDSVTSIGDFAFYNCSVLKDVYYDGLLNDWDVITIGSYNECLTNATISHLCTYCDWVINSETTCTEDGSRSKSCLVCGETVTETFEATGHIYSDDWTIDLAATCTEDGSKSHHCTVCGDKKDITVIVATGHNFEITETLSIHPHTTTYTCSYCGDERAEFPVSSSCIECNFVITLIDSSVYKLVSYFGNETDVVIPASYEGSAITTIANSCFKGNTSIISVEIEEGVNAIGSLAFMNCTSLEKVTIPVSITSIGTQTFYGFTGTIYCKSGSFAHEYAIANNIKYVLESTGGQEEPIEEKVNTRIDYDNSMIFTSVRKCSDITEILGLSVSAIVIPTASCVNGNLELYGTGTIISVFNGNDYIGDFTLIVEGDLNGDSVCNVLDTFDAERASNGHIDVSTEQIYAANGMVSDELDVNSYQNVVNMALAS